MIIMINCLFARNLGIFLYISLFAVLMNWIKKKKMLTITHFFYDSKISYNQVFISHFKVFFISQNLWILISWILELSHAERLDKYCFIFSLKIEFDYT